MTAVIEYNAKPVRIKYADCKNKAYMMTNEEIKSKNTKKIILTAVYIAYTFFIFSNSMQDASESSGRSMAVLEIFDEIFGHNVFTELFIRKAAHFTEFAVLGMLGANMSRMYDRGIIYMLFTGMLTALTDETIQLFSAGRSSQVTDVWIDFAGCMFGVFTALLLSYIIRKRADG